MPWFPWLILLLALLAGFEVAQGREPAPPVLLGTSISHAIANSSGDFANPV